MGIIHPKPIRQSSSGLKAKL
uniref:Uncharacterized protein n=1 Tax=Rhizophora mucronata TaxID=61149 RepID=A0A2P2Q034_RHIMU